MQVNGMQPSFHGLIMTPDKKSVINPQYVVSIEERVPKRSYETEPRTNMWLINGTHFEFNTPLDSVLSAYQAAMCDNGIHVIGEETKKE